MLLVVNTHQLVCIVLTLWRRIKFIKVSDSLTLVHVTLLVLYGDIIIYCDIFINRTANRFLIYLYFITSGIFLITLIL